MSSLLLSSIEFTKLQLQFITKKKKKREKEHNKLEKKNNLSFSFSLINNNYFC